MNQIRSAQIRRAQITLAAVSLVAGLLGVALADGSFTNHSGSDVGYADLELHLMSFNRFGALLAIALGAIALAGALMTRRAVVAAAAIGYSAFALQVLLGARKIDGGNVTGSNGATLSFCLMMAIGLGVTAWFDRAADDAADIAA